MKPLIALILAGCLVSPAVARADSLVFTRDSNVWLANAEGSGQYQVTLDGTAASPYESPSQADDGTIVAIRQPPGHRSQLFRMTQSGALLNPPVDTPAPGTGAIDARVSPDGRRVAYRFAGTVRDLTSDQSVTGTLDGNPVTIADGLDAPLTDEFEQRAGAALGVPVSGGIALLPRFTRTGAP